MKLLRRIVDGVTDENVCKRIGWLYVTFFGIFFPVAAASHYLLPESFLRGKHPLASQLELSPSFLASWLQILGYNLIPAALLVGANLFAERSRVSKERFMPVGYLVFWTLTLFCAVVLGTWSFDVVTPAPPLHTKLLRTFDVVHHSGLLEFSAYLLAAAASAPLTLCFLDRGKPEPGKRTWKDALRLTKLVRSRHWKDVTLSRAEKAFMVLAFVLLLCAAAIESHHIIELSKAASGP